MTAGTGKAAVAAPVLPDAAAAATNASPRLPERAALHLRGANGC